MGFGKFLKKALNPLTPFKAGAKSIGQLAKGNVKGALRSSLDAVPGSPTLGMGGGAKILDPSVASGLGLERMPGANVQGGIAPGMVDRGIVALVRNPKRGQPTPPPAAGPAAPPPPGMAAAGMAPPPGMAQMGMAPPQGAEQMGMAAPPQPFLESVQQAIAPSEFSDPYEAQKQRRIRGY